MALARGERITVSMQTRTDALDLSPEEYFVLSRLSGSTTVGELALATGLPRLQAEALIAALIARGVIVRIGLAGESATEPPDDETSGAEPKQRSKSPVRAPSGPTNAMQRRALQRRARVLAAQMSAAGRGLPPPVARPQPPSKPEPNEKAVGDATPAHSAVEAVRAWATAHCRAAGLSLQADVALEAVDQHLLMALDDVLKSGALAEFWSVVAARDDARLRASYLELSRELHPDRFYGQELGPLSVVVNRVFAGLRKAFDERGRAIARGLAAGPQVPPKTAVADPQVQAKIAHYRSQGESEELAGRLGAAAGMYRLALGLDPGDAELKRRWQLCRAKAQRARARRCFRAASDFADIGDAAAAARLFEEAAKIDPSPWYLAHAGLHLAGRTPSKAREFALSTLDALHAAEQLNARPPAEELRMILVACARTFIQIGQKQTALVQLRRARECAPGDEEVEELIQSLRDAA